MVVNLLVNGTESTPLGDDLVPVLPCLIDIGSERDVTATTVFRGVLKTGKETIMQEAIQIQPLMPGHLTAICHMRETQLRVLLITTALLTLS
jgi:hypothetical protein